ncbi:MAG: hypothetical protein J6Y48_02770 [Clostridia bacterium]|nr:hypothetical protein [Clostridia bacterium]
MNWETIIPTVITALCALAGTYFANKKQTAMMEYRLQQVEKKIGIHNGFESRLVKVETEIKDMKAS